MSAAAIRLELDDLPATSPTEARHDEWKRIEREAHEQAMKEVDVLNETPLVFGHHIAWSHTNRHETESITALHRVGYPKHGNPYTACGEPIPHPLRWFPLSPALIKHMPRCRFCENEYPRLVREVSE